VTDTELISSKATKLRLTVLEAIYRAGKGHIGGAFSCADILATLFYGGFLRFDPTRPDWEDRDRFVLSKGHSGIALLSALADLGYFEESELLTYGRNGSRFGGHPDRNIPGIEADSGSLGHGLGIAVGMALAAKMDRKNCRTYVLMGDGECYEGSVWEALAFGAHHELSDLTAIIDRNGQCVLDYTEDCVRLDPLDKKLSAFGWETVEVDGHSPAELCSALSRRRERAPGRPLAVIAHTVKGKGVSFMEGKIEWHHAVPSPGQYEEARRELLAGKE
jgi:transketolase